MRRRDAITLLGGAAAALPLAARGQQDRRRRISVLMSTRADDPEGQTRIAAFLGGLQQLGWTDGRNVEINTRWATGDAEGRKYAAELVALAPDVIIAPSVTRVAVLRNPADPAGTGQWGAIQSVAPSFGVELIPLGVRDPSEIERAVNEFARGSNGGLIVVVGGLVIVHRELIIALAARYGLPAVYFNRMYVTGGGLISYGPENFDQYRRAAGYVDRILKGEKPAELPVQAPTKYQLVINLKTAKALGIDVPPSLLARADEVVE